MLAGSLEIVNVRVVDPLAVEGDERVGDGPSSPPATSTSSLPSGCSSIRSAPGSMRARVGDLGPAGCGLVALARRADVDDVVVVLDGGVLRRWAAD